MAQDTSLQGFECTVIVSETVAEGCFFKFGASWPNVLLTTAENEYAAGVFAAAGVSGDRVKAHLICANAILKGKGTVTAGAAIAPGASGLAVAAGTGDRVCGLALESATADTFSFIPLPPGSGGLLA